jgi:hypothetical protein
MIFRKEEVVAKLRFSQFSGSFEPILHSFAKGNINCVYYPSQRNAKLAKIILKIDEP